MRGARPITGTSALRQYVRRHCERSEAIQPIRRNAIE
jgi:hypothetical protein